MQTRGRANIIKPKRLYPGMVKYPLPKALVAIQDNADIEPTSYSAAYKSSGWRARDTEFNALLQNGTWTLIPP